MFGDFKRRLRDAALIEEALVKLAAERNGTGRPPRLEALEFVLDDVVRGRL